jgi:pilus assembly protein Flp/PilA
MLQKVISLLKEEEGQSMVEYGIILALISVVAIGVVQAVGGKVTGAFNKVDGELGTALGGGGGQQPAPPPANP